MNSQNPNNLIHSQSPYLRQHAYNPVDWFPWGDEALSRAEKENKPILLSIGYSTCHWCHVMEHESFADNAVASLMNRHFVCIKVDREERPDLDKIYITAVSAMTGSAGWPLNVFLTPKRLPFFGGTYFPPETRPGIPSWTEVLKTIAEHWTDPGRQDKLKASGRHIQRTLERHLAWAPDPTSDTGSRNTAFDRLAAAFDPQAGGFSRAPKFPSPGILQFLMAYHAAQPGNNRLDRKRADQALKMTQITLRAMAQGGICDQIGGGFHRYATDDNWQIPHFEKMLYDNAQLLSAYVMAFQLTADPQMADVARQTADYVLRDLQHGAGGFYAAEDADSQVPDDTLPAAAGNDHPAPNKEGAFYLWSQAEIDKHLSPSDAAVFKHHSAIRSEGNAAQDPHGEFNGYNIIHDAQSIGQTAADLGQSEEAIARILKRARQKLFEVRASRPRPHLDRKIITAWNGLMITALAQAYQALGEERYLSAARRAADFVLERLYDRQRQSLFRCRLDGDPQILGIADDYLFFVQALLDLYESDFQPHWLQKARVLMDKAVELFYDGTTGGFFMTRRDHDPHLIMRVKEDADSVLPSAASIGALNLIRLVRLSGHEALAEMAHKTINAGLSRMKAYPEALPMMLVAGLHAETPLVQVTIAGASEDAGTAAMIAVARSSRFMGRALAVVDNDDARQHLAIQIPFVRQAAAAGDTPRAWVCINRSCRAPVASPEALQATLEAAMTS